MYVWSAGLLWLVPLAAHNVNWRVSNDVCYALRLVKGSQRQLITSCEPVPALQLMAGSNLRL